MAKAHIHVIFKLESDVNDYVKTKLTALGLKKLIDFNEESGMSDYMKEALKGSAKTKDKKRRYHPDARYFSGVRGGIAGTCRSAECGGLCICDGG